jgi:zinc protease
MRYRMAILFALVAANPLSAADNAYREVRLQNGMRVITVEQPGAPVVAVHLWYHVGSKDEQPGRQGFAHMFEHMMFRGTDRLGPEDHFKFIRRTGGDCNAYTAFDQTVYVQELPAAQLELALWLEAERMGFLKIDQQSFDTERKVVEEERRLGLNRPYGSIAEQALAELFGGRAYAWSPIGNIAHLRASSVQDLRDFWQRYYVPNNATLVIVGAIEHDAAQKLAAKYFDWMPKEADPPRVPVPPPGHFNARKITLKDDSAPAPGVGAIWRAVPANHDDYIPLLLLGTILGGGDSSRLYRELVADKQLAVVALSTAFSLEYDGLFAAAAIMTPFSKNNSAILDVIKAQVERLGKEPVTERELLKAKNAMLYGLAQQELSAATRAALVGNAAVLQGDTARAFTQLDRVRKVTAADLQRVAQKYLTPDGMVTGVIEQNLLGSLLGKKKSAEEESPITAKPETGPPPKVKAGLNRPTDFPDHPPVAAFVKSATPKHERFTLPNGLKVIVVPRPGVALASAELGLLTGAWSEFKPGAASMAANMITKGTAKHNAKELAEELDTYAINMGGNASLDAATISASCLHEHLPRAMTLLAEVARTPTFPADELEKLRKQVVTNLAISAKEPAAIAEREMRKQLFGTHPYSRLPTGEKGDVEALKVDDLSGWWTANCQPGQSVLLVSGNVTTDEVRKLAESAFGDWKGTTNHAAAQLPEPPEAKTTRIVLVDQPGAIQSQIRIAQRSMPRNHPDYAVSRVVSDYFGGSFSSRLNEVIRVQKGLTYGASGGFQPDKFAGRFVASTFSKTESTAAAVSAALAEIERVRTEGPSDRELSDTKANFIGKVALQRETPQQVAGELWRAELYGLPSDTVDRNVARATATKAEECLSFAREWIDPAKLVIVVVGSAEKLKAELEKIAPVTVVPSK